MPRLRDLVRHAEARAHAGSIHRHGLLREDVLSRLNRRLDVNGAEARRRRQDHVVDVGLQELLEGIEPHEAVVLRDGRRIGVLLGQRLAALVQPIAERVRQRHDANAWRRLEDIARRPRAASAAAHQADANLITAGGVRADQAVETRGDRRGHRGRGGARG